MGKNLKKKEIKSKLQELVDWPTKDYPRRTEDGFPSEMVYDQFAYERIVEFYRGHIRRIIRKM